MVSPSIRSLLVLAKVTGLSWASLKLILAMREMSGGDVSNIDDHQSSYDMLRPSTAQQVLRFYRMRQTSAQIEPLA